MLKLKKFALVLSITALAIFIVGGSIVFAEKTSIIPDKKVISEKQHVQKIKEFTDKGDSEGLDQFLSSLDSKELLETAAELADQGEAALFQDGLFLVKHFNKKWSDGVPLEDLSIILSDKSYNIYFRTFLVDAIEKKKNNDQVEAANQLILNIAIDKTEDEKIRKFAIEKFREVSKIDSKKEEQYKNLEEVFYDKDSSPELKGAVLTSMRRVKHPNLKKIVDEVLLDYNNKEGILIRRAVVSGVKAKCFEDTEKIKEIALKTNDSEVYQTMIYSLGLVGNEDGLKKALSLSGKFDSEDITGYVISSNSNIVLEMLDINNNSEDSILNALKAARFVKLHDALEKIKTIADNHPNEKIRKIASETHTEIDDAPRPSGGLNLYKWEKN